LIALVEGDVNAAREQGEALKATKPTLYRSDADIAADVQELEVGRFFEVFEPVKGSKMTEFIDVYVRGLRQDDQIAPSNP